MATVWTCTKCGMSKVRSLGFGFLGKPDECPHCGHPELEGPEVRGWLHSKLSGGSA